MGSYRAAGSYRTLQCSSAHSNPGCRHVSAWRFPSICARTARCARFAGQRRAHVGDRNPRGRRAAPALSPRRRRLRRHHRQYLGRHRRRRPQRSTSSSSRRARGTHYAVGGKSLPQRWRIRLDHDLLAADADAELAWLPQESILFDGARLSRRLDVDVAAGALTIKEGVVFGRTARPELMRHGLFHDRWRIRRDGRLLLAENVRLDGDIAATLDARPPAGARAPSPRSSMSRPAEQKLDAVRARRSRRLRRRRQRLERNAGRPPRRASRASGPRRVGRVLACLLPGVSPRIWSC